MSFRKPLQTFFWEEDESYYPSVGIIFNNSIYLVTEQTDEGENPSNTPAKFTNLSQGSGGGGSADIRSGQLDDAVLGTNNVVFSTPFSSANYEVVLQDNNGIGIDLSSIVKSDDGFTFDVFGEVVTPNSVTWIAVYI